MSKILRIDLGTQQISTETVDPSLEEKYIGGSGVAVAILTEEVSPETDAFDPINRLIFSVGPFCGTLVPYCGRHFVTAKSPLTGLIGESSSGGFFGKELKFTGYDHVIIQGKSEKPVFLWINNDQVEIKDAGELWGKKTSETEAAVKSILGDEKVLVASIGIAGEKLVKYACIMNEETRAAGRCGLGAVMGSKNLKAIAVRGSIKPEVADKEALKEVVKGIHGLLKDNPMNLVYKNYGTPTSMDTMAGVGDVPIKNYTLSRWKGTKKLGTTAIEARGEVKHHACYNCPTACTGIIESDGKWSRWPEYETLAMLGSNLQVDDLEKVIEWNRKVNDFGMDTISLGGTIAMFLEAAATGKIEVNLEDYGVPKDPETGEWQVWGCIEAIEKLIDLIGNRNGIGDELAEGVHSFCEKNNLPAELNTTAKKMEIPAHEPRCNNMTALDYATTPRGAYHCYLPMHLSTTMNLKKEVGLTAAVDRFDTTSVGVEAVVKIQNVSEAYCACGGCIFGFNFLNEITPWIESLNAITGGSMTVESWVKVGQDLWDLKRKYSIKCGISKADDKIGARFSKLIKKGGTRKNVPPVADMLPLYYEARGWDAEGIPPN
jgi:aldehyde:ferredoxin oxidoreductase